MKGLFQVITRDCGSPARESVCALVHVSCVYVRVYVRVCVRVCVCVGERESERR